MRENFLSVKTKSRRIVFALCLVPSVKWHGYSVFQYVCVKMELSYVK